VGIPWSTLRAFIQGAHPRKETRRKLVEWYVRTLSTRGDALTPELARAFVSVLVEGLPTAKREEAERGVWTMLERAFQEAGTPPPSWLLEMRKG
jgi:hypothetical protein